MSGGNKIIWEIGEEWWTDEIPASAFDKEGTSYFIHDMYQTDSNGEPLREDERYRVPCKKEVYEHSATLEYKPDSENAETYFVGIATLRFADKKRLKIDSVNWCGFDEKSKGREPEVKPY